MRLGDNKMLLNHFWFVKWIHFHSFPESLSGVEVVRRSARTAFAILCHSLYKCRLETCRSYNKASPDELYRVVRRTSHECAKSKTKQFKDFDNPWLWHTLTIFDLHYVELNDRRRRSGLRWIERTLYGFTGHGPACVFVVWGFWL